MLVAAALLPIMVRASFDFGVTWDEHTRHRYGQLVWEFLRGLRARSTFDQGDGLQHLYGGLFDVICVALEPYVPLNRYVFRHVVNAVFGWVGVVFCGRLAARLFGTWSGVLAMILLASSPRYFAASMNNPKDLPLAVTTFVALYYISTVSPKWPYLSWTTAAKIAIALALALNIRAAALIYLGYLGLLVGMYVLVERVMSWRRLADTSLRLGAVAVAMLLLGTIFWPWAQQAPFVRPFEALFSLAHFPRVGEMLFAGGVETSDELPWYYAPWWFLISTPPVVLVGAMLAAASRDSGRATRRYALWAVTLFPIVMVIVQRSTLYGGIRHLLFVYPILVVLAASGWTAWLSARNRPWVRRSAAGLLAAGLVNVLAFDVRSYPNQTAYFNEVVGGPRGAFARYEMDHWGNCLLEAVAWSAETAKLSDIAITISGDPEHLVQFNADRFPTLVFASPAARRHHLDLRVSRGSARGIRGLATRPDALYKVQTADGALLCVVVPGPAFAKLQPHLASPPGARLLTR